jgi:hypothetical protein
LTGTERRAQQVFIVCGRSLTSVMSGVCDRPG